MNKKKFVEQLKQLVEIRTLSGEVEANKKALDLVETWLDKKINIERYKNGKAEVMVASVNKGMSPEICYMVHMDVVAGTDKQFKLKIVGDKLFGRGTCDMKFSIPLGVELINEAVAKNLDLCLIITTDEETGGLEGAKYLREVLNFSPKLLIVPDGGEDLNFVDKAKGVCQIRVVAKGKPAHASRPWQGKNALANIVKLVQKLLDDYEQYNLVEGWNTTMNIGVINGGISTNQVCAEAEVKLDFRYSESDSIENIKNKVEVLTNEIDGEWNISLMSTGMPTFTEVSEPRVVKYIETMNKAFGREIMVRPTYGASDARHFADLKVPVIMHKPIGGEIHSDGEWISLSSVMTFFQGMCEYLGLTI
jgi:succinyl-diaminopimelate desuccinylase